MIIFAIIILAINLILWFVLFKFLKKTFSYKGALSEIKQEAEKIIIEINRETDNSITLMESKINHVKEIIDTAEKKIMLYENTLIQKDNEKQLYQQLTDFQAKQNTPIKKAIKGYKANSSSEQDYLPLFTENAGTSDFQDLKNDSNKTDKKEDPATETVKIIQGEKVEPKVLVQDQIIKLAKEGFTPELIASKLNVSINVVTMTIDLYL